LNGLLLELIPYFILEKTELLELNLRENQDVRDCEVKIILKINYQTYTACH